jgi:predicted nucleotidyltransferase
MSRVPQSEASGKFVLRIEPGLHRALREAARESGLSLNDYCARKLAAPMGNLTSIEWGAAAVERAAVLFGEQLVGVAAFGSWARGELSEISDVDLLVVLESSVELTRALYRAWDERPVTANGRTLEPHFVHLPALERRIGAVWGEVALDGIVLFERGFRVSSTLVQVRRDILSGRMVRRIIHGQPYWTEVA